MLQAIKKARELVYKEDNKKNWTQKYICETVEKFREC